MIQRGLRIEQSFVLVSSDQERVLGQRSPLWPGHVSRHSSSLRHFVAPFSYISLLLMLSNSHSDFRQMETRLREVSRFPNTMLIFKSRVLFIALQLPVRWTQNNFYLPCSQLSRKKHSDGESLQLYYSIIAK